VGPPGSLIITVGPMLAFVPIGPNGRGTRLHPVTAAGDPIYYTAMVATKLRDIPASMLVEGNK
jgi:hypothetical protein